METITRVVPGANGESIQVEEIGASDGKPVLVHPGSPGTRRIYRPDAELAARDFGLRILSFDRPGYAGRPPSPGRRIADLTTDVQHIADALGIERLGVWGQSGGGSYALACAALLPELVTGAAVFASFAPYGSPGLDFCGNWPDELRHEVDLFFTDRPTARENWRRDSEHIYAALSTPDGWMARWGETAGTDATHSQAVADHLAAEFRDALADGDDGYWDDWAALLTPWGFDPTTPGAPIQLWHGAGDRAVPLTNGHWLAANIPGIQAHFSDTEDHTNVEDNNRIAAYTWLRDLT